MNREDGFPIADLDVGLLHDQKIVALARRIRDERRTATCIALYVGLVLESWSAGDRLTLDEAVPAWWMGELDDIRDNLAAVGLIDEESRIPPEPWASWFVPAFDRRERRRQSGAEGGKRSWQSRRDKRRRSDASALPNPSDRPAGRPSDRQDRPDAAAQCARCDGALAADNETVVYVDGRYKSIHRTCPGEEPRSLKALAG